mmetsp:Transcript_26184/g.44152  ORF Transcript_26184/g.44152 Transcript_26184/m.44152 type:complete len:217 (+) Transcript_26184:665-1315(+)
MCLCCPWRAVCSLSRPLEETLTLEERISTLAWSTGASPRSRRSMARLLPLLSRLLFAPCSACVVLARLPSAPSPTPMSATSRSMPLSVPERAFLPPSPELTSTSSPSVSSRDAWILSARCLRTPTSREMPSPMSSLSEDLLVSPLFRTPLCPTLMTESSCASLSTPMRLLPSELPCRELSLSLVEPVVVPTSPVWSLTWCSSMLPLFLSVLNLRAR